MRITIVSEVFSPKIGGMERYAEDMAMYWSEQGIAVEIITDTPDKDHRQITEQYSIRRGLSFTEKVRVFRASEIIFFVGITIENILAAYLARRRAVVSHHGVYIYSNEFSHYIKGMIKRLLCRPMNNISVSNFVAREIGGKQKVILNGYRDDLFFPPQHKPNPRTFIFCGRLVPDKGVDLLISAFSQVHQTYPDASLVIIGDGCERGKLTSQVNQYNLSHRVTFLGSQALPKVGEQLRQSTCLVVPSRWNEPFGIVALEGLASGCEVIATARGGLPEALGGHGRIVAPDADAIAAAMLEVCDSKRNRQETDVSKYLQSRCACCVAAEYSAYLFSSMSQHDVRRNWVK
ncbi:glycosyltransferase family 4 protein [Photobacterium atrarenae]|uniref:Glycosyltransferase family 4 protein n=1 Tax=Photobacterium atrarenae TaxID=865757 RepID=A0ABY5GP49_9GAMM|nr:glycosyltransferase family 4 protein [Photobacterium atrarenae]UTV30459.1 glycosyltransferase family 4 protein [Photobacterium atrarenae]